MKNFKEIYRIKAQNKLNTASDVIILCAYKALNAKSNQDKVSIFKALLDKAFSPITNTVKLKNGQTAYRTLELLLYGKTLYNNLDQIMYSPHRIIREEEIAENAEELELFYSLFKTTYDSLVSDSNNPLNTIFYSYIIVEPTLSFPQQLVQATHAGIELGHVLAKEKISVENLHLVAVHSPKPYLIEEYNSFINNKLNIASVTFVEPDLDNAVTAIATYPIARKNKGYFKQLTLIR